MSTTSFRQWSMRYKAGCNKFSDLLATGIGRIQKLDTVIEPAVGQRHLSHHLAICYYFTGIDLMDMFFIRSSGASSRAVSQRTPETLILCEIPENFMLS